MIVLLLPVPEPPVYRYIDGYHDALRWVCCYYDY